MSVKCKTFKGVMKWCCDFCHVWTDFGTVRTNSEKDSKLTVICFSCLRELVHDIGCKAITESNSELCPRVLS
jgi:hypothetical protein